MRFPEKGKTYSINEGNYIKFPNGVKKYIKFCQKRIVQQVALIPHVTLALWWPISTATC